MNINNRKIIILSGYIYDNFNQEKTKLTYYIASIIDKVIEKNIVCFIDEEIDELCNNESAILVQLTRGIISLIRKNGVKSNIKITKGIDYYIENTEFGRNRFNKCRDFVLRATYNISKLDKKEKGNIFEKFCSYFLNDIGVYCKTTTISRDGGIDILGVINIDADNLLSKLVFIPNIYLLAQVKCYDSRKVDTSIIRHLISDSLYYKTNNFKHNIILGNKPLYLVLFSYSGFTEPALEFAKKSGVVTLDIKEIIDIICNSNSFDKFKSIRYLLDIQALY